MCQWPRVNQIKEKFKNFNFFPLHDNSPVNGKMSSRLCSTIFFNFHVLHTCLVEYNVQYIHGVCSNN